MPLAFNSNYTNTVVAGNPPTYTITKTAGNTTRVGCITPWLTLADNNHYVQPQAGGGGARPALPSASQSIFPNCPCSAIDTKIYRTYCDLYEEVKLDQMTVSMSVLDPLGSATLPSLAIATAWDRKAGLGEVIEQFQWQDSTANRADIPNPSDANYYKVGANPLMISSDYPASYDDLVAGPAATEATAINNSVAKIFRSCKASDLLERNTFHDSAYIVNTGAHMAYDKAWYTTATNTQQLYFSPAFYFALKLMGTSAGDGATINVQLEINYYFTFRNPKFGGDVSSSAGLMRAIAEQRYIASQAQAIAAIPAEAADSKGDEERDEYRETTRKKARTIEDDVVLDSASILDSTLVGDSTDGKSYQTTPAAAAAAEVILDEETKL